MVNLKKLTNASFTVIKWKYTSVVNMCIYIFLWTMEYAHENNQKEVLCACIYIDFGCSLIVQFTNEFKCSLVRSLSFHGCTFDKKSIMMNFIRDFRNNSKCLTFINFLTNFSTPGGSRKFSMGDVITFTNYNI